MIKRKKYLQGIWNVYHDKNVKVLAGMRKSGKTTILKQIVDDLIEEGVGNEYVIHINFEYLIYEELKDYEMLYSYIEKLIVSDDKYYIFIDDIQNVSSFEKMLLRLLDEFNVSIFITITNSSILSSELGTLLEWKYKLYNIYPFSYNEWLEALNIYHSNEDLMDYLILGGIPQITNISDFDTKVKSIGDSLNSIIYKDIIEIVTVKNVPLLQKLIEYVIQNTSEVLSVQAILLYLKKINISVSNDTIYTYLNYIKNSSIVNECKKYDLVNKKSLSKLHKLYINDLGFRRITLNSVNVDLSSTIETAVYNHLKYLGYKIYFTSIGDYEIDFYITKIHSGKIDKKYIQVTYKMEQEVDTDKIIQPLLDIGNRHSRYIISMDEYDISIDGIEHIKLSDFLLDEEF